MATGSEAALHTLAHVVVERLGNLKEIRDSSDALVDRQALEAIIKACEQVQDAWADNERRSGLEAMHG